MTHELVSHVNGEMNKYGTCIVVHDCHYHIHELVPYRKGENEQYDTCSNDELVPCMNVEMNNVVDVVMIVLVSYMNGEMRKYGTCSIYRASVTYE